jgi:hypothetical protein
MSTVCPATVNVVDRTVALDAFDATDTNTVPLPVPESGDTVAQGAGLDATHEQFDPLVLITIAPIDGSGPNGVPRPAVSIVALHDRPACDTWNGCPPMVSVPDRATVVEFGATEYSSVPGPAPDSPPVMAIQLGPGTVL